VNNAVSWKLCLIIEEKVQIWDTILFLACSSESVARIGKAANETMRNVPLAQSV
jgi:hypothetical protein